jgi:hypothetical protein
MVSALAVMAVCANRCDSAGTITQREMHLRGFAVIEELLTMALAHLAWSETGRAQRLPK